MSWASRLRPHAAEDHTFQMVIPLRRSLHHCDQGDRWREVDPNYLELEFLGCGLVSAWKSKVYTALTFLNTGLQVSMHTKYMLRYATIPLFIDIVRDDEKQIKPRQERVW
jgi:hypothetical protein